MDEMFMKWGDPEYGVTGWKWYAEFVAIVLIWCLIAPVFWFRNKVFGLVCNNR